MGNVGFHRPNVDMNNPIINFPPAGPPTQTKAESFDTSRNACSACACNNPCACCGCPYYCCLCGGEAHTDFNAHVLSNAAQGLVARATEMHGATHSGCCCCISTLQHDDVWFEKEETLADGAELESHVEEFEIDYEVTVQCYKHMLQPVVEDIQKMEAKLNALANEGWSLRTIFDSPSQKASQNGRGSCCTKFYGSGYSAAFYRNKNKQNQKKKISLISVECPGSEFYIWVGSGKDRHLELERREMDMTPVQTAIHEGYQRGARMATAIVEGQQSMGGSECRPVTRLFFLFFEEFQDPSLNVPYVAYVTLGSRMMMYSRGCCTPPSYQYDTHIMRSTWETAGRSGWRAAEIFDTGREKVPHGSYGHGFGARFKDSMMVFEAPMSAVQDGQMQQGLYHYDQPLQGGIQWNTQPGQMNPMGGPAAPAAPPITPMPPSYGQAAGPPPPPAAPPPPPGAKDGPPPAGYDGSGRPYWMNPETGQTQWEPPSSQSVLKT